MVSFMMRERELRVDFEGKRYLIDKGPGLWSWSGRFSTCRNRGQAGEEHNQGAQRL